MATNLEVRLLLELWNPDDVPVGLGKLNKQCGGKAADNNAIRESLIAAGKVSQDPRSEGFRLTEAGKDLLAELLLGDKFEFTANFGKRTTNVLLRWFRSNSVSAKPIEKAAGSAIESYEAFKAVALETFDRLNRDFNMDNLVPIYRIRREIGERVERSEFSTWLLEMQSNDVFQLLEGGIEDNAPEKLEDSVQTKLGKLRCYAKYITP